ncbi:MAG: hypothetical protein AMJ69_04765 [Gammaproteobacteria bacterium SG8_47]|nr:MAG: hypothetical protein AMJ69_04765 [Gammaproteobacteria bacterium SG8_47]
MPDFELESEHTPVPETATGDLADLLVRYLDQLGVDYVFGLPGGAIEPFYNALARGRRRGGPDAIVMRHETGAAFAGDGYYWTTGKMAVVAATTGPGATNLMTGVASAKSNEIPMLVITAQTALPHMGRGAFQDSSDAGIDTIAMFNGITKFNSLVSHRDQFEHKLASAILSAMLVPRGPVHLSVPRDVFCQQGPQYPSFDLKKLLADASSVNQHNVRPLIHRLRKCAEPVFVLGEGAADAVDLILELALQLGGSVVTTPHGKGLINPHHPLYRGVVGFAGHESANATLTNPNVDVVAAVGTNLGEWASAGWDTRTLLNERLIHIDASAVNLRRSPMASLHVQGDPHAIFEQVLLALVDPSSDTEEAMRTITAQAERDGDMQRYFTLDDEEAFTDHAVPIRPARLMNELGRRLPPSTRYCADTGNSLAWAIHYLMPADRRLWRRRANSRTDSGPRTERRSGGRRWQGPGLFRGALEFASMGWAIGAAIGASLGSRPDPVVCITGDGSVLMSGQELTVATQLNLPIIWIILNDSAYGMVKHGQRMTGAEPIAFDLPSVDFAQVAAGQGARSQVITSVEDLDRVDFDEIIASGVPYVLDVRIDPGDAPPMGARIKVLTDN